MIARCGSRRHNGLSVLLVLVAFAVGACGGVQAPPSASVTVTGGGATTAPPAASVSATADRAPGSPSPAGPPYALLEGLADGQGAAGALGSFTWDGSGSDALWLTGPPAGSAERGASLRVTFDGAIPVRWQARWGRIEAAVVGTPLDGGAGTSPDLALHAPETAGAWSLAVTASFGAGRGATWTWRIEVGP